ncbi:hypothetical protein HMPREF0518_1911 [Lactobacillus helveticus DSM 20075 = CGMCC 1.1877]|nr:hypothetical protein HMPREF0518_1911 [Lactobacillus helveticus DSM 20075 = CGMCC 1.1877]
MAANFLIKRLRHSFLKVAMVRVIVLTELIREFIARDGGKNNTYTSALVVDGNRVDESDVEVKRWLKTI